MTNQELRQMIDLYAESKLDGQWTDDLVRILCNEVERTTRNDFFRSMQTALNETNYRVNVHGILMKDENHRLTDTMEKVKLS